MATSEITSQTLGDHFFEVPESSGRWHQVLIGKNLGRTTIKLCLPIREFIDMSAVSNRQTVETVELYKNEFQAQRQLDPAHATGLARYTLMGLVQAAITSRSKKGQPTTSEIIAIREQLGNPAYVSLQPVVGNIRSCKPEGSDLTYRDIGKSFNTQTGHYEILLGQKQLIWVVDGQHRRAGFDRVLDFLKKVTTTYRYPKQRPLFVPSSNPNGLIDHATHAFWSSINELAITAATVSIECHLGLDEKEEQQLFYDLNSKGKKVTQSLAFKFDHTDPINKFISDDLLPADFFKFEPSEKDLSDWNKDDGTISRKAINTVTCFLCSGKGTSKTATPALVNARADYLLKFWQVIFQIEHFGDRGAKSKTIAAQPIVLKALAKLAFDLSYGHQNIQNSNGYKNFLSGILDRSLDFDHSNPLWSALLLNDEERERNFPGISDYVVISPGLNLDVGTLDSSGCIRFGSRHNDIIPRLTDCVRYKLDLGPRPSVKKLVEQMKVKSL